MGGGVRSGTLCVTQLVVTASCSLQAPPYPLPAPSPAFTTSSTELLWFHAVLDTEALRQRWAFPGLQWDPAGLVAAAFI